MYLAWSEGVGLILGSGTPRAALAQQHFSVFGGQASCPFNKAPGD